MALTVALLEGGSLFAAVSGVILFWAHPLLLDWPDVAAHVAKAMFLCLCCVVSFYYNDLYDIRRVSSFGEFSLRLLQSLGVSFILLAVFYTLFPDLRLADGPFLSSLLILVLLLLPLRGVLYAIMKAGTITKRLLILGTSPLAWKIAEEIGAVPHLRYSIVGFVDDSDDSRPVPMGAPLQPPYPMLGPLERLEKIIEELRPDRIIVALTERRSRLPVWDLLNLRMTGVLVEDGIEVYERLTRKLAIESLTPSSVIFSKDFKERRLQMALRRAFSLAVSSIGLILTAPLMMIIAFAIKLDSEGPVFFSQARAGKDGTIFNLIKFRTMRSGDESPGSVWARDDAGRITRVGKWLRKLHLDELPQFINILKGDMDLVGPRPEMLCNVKTMTEKIPYYSLRAAVRPGLTGWAQIKHGYSVSVEDVTEKIRHDLYYIKHLSLWFDLRILLDTVKIVLLGRGAQ